jgi:hypothetical protein
VTEMEKERESVGREGVVKLQLKTEDGDRDADDGSDGLRGGRV